MILIEDVKNVELSNSFQKKEFSIKNSSKAFSILADKIYSNKIRAVLREISCNAYDSHVEAKNPAPFDVHLPTYLESWFSVRDYGTGISPESMNTFYSEVFTSTRGNSNDFVGSLGIGRLSPFCLCDSFTLESFYRGTKSVYSVYKDNLGIPQIALLTQNETVEPNGVLVSVTVPSSQTYEFQHEAVKVFKHFDNIPNINVSSVKDQIKDQIKEYLVDNEEFSISSNYGDLFAVMGNIAYLIDSSLNPDHFSGIIKFKIGELNFDSGREKLSLDVRTKENAIAKVQKVRGSIARILLEQVEAEPTHFSKVLMLHKLDNGHLSGIIKASTLDFYKYRIKSSTVQFKRYEKYGKRVIESSMQKLPLDKTEYYLKKDGFTARIREYVKTSGISLCLLSQDVIDEIQIDPSYIKDLGALPKVQRTPSGKTPTSGIELLSGGRSLKVTDIPVGEKVYIEVCRDRATNYTYSFLHNPYADKWLSKLTHITIPDIYLVKTAVAKKKSFMKDDWISLPDYIKREYSKVKKGRYIAYDGLYEHVFKRSFELKGFIWPADNPVVTFVQKMRLRKNSTECPILKEVGYYDPEAVDNELNDLEKQILENYPMLRFANTSEYSYKIDEEDQITIAKYLGAY